MTEPKKEPLGFVPEAKKVQGYEDRNGGIHLKASDAEAFNLKLALDKVLGVEFQAQAQHSMEILSGNPTPEQLNGLEMLDTLIRHPSLCEGLLRTAKLKSSSL